MKSLVRFMMQPMARTTKGPRSKPDSTNVMGIPRKPQPFAECQEARSRKLWRRNTRHDVVHCERGGDEEAEALVLCLLRSGKERSFQEERLSERGRALSAMGLHAAWPVVQPPPRASGQVQSRKHDLSSKTQQLAQHRWISRRVGRCCGVTRACATLAHGPRLRASEGRMGSH